MRDDADVVAYSFKRSFIPAIRLGLGLDPIDPEPGARRPKRQTIRADRRRHARPGEQLQLYSGMRTKHCTLIGRARCTDILPIEMRFAKPRRTVSKIIIGGRPVIYFAAGLDAFAERDGFASWDDMRDFWRENHPGIDEFHGVIIEWEPLA